MIHAHGPCVFKYLNKRLFFSEISSYTFKRDADEDELSLALPESQSATSLINGATCDLIENGTDFAKTKFICV